MGGHMPAHSTYFRDTLYDDPISSSPLGSIQHLISAIQSDIQAGFLPAE
jgi:hypothetical protein